MEINIGEYIRTNDGIIAKCISIIPEKEDCEKLYCFNKDVIYDSYEPEHQMFPEELGKYISKHSFNLMDLIEYGDLVKFRGMVNVKDIRNQVELGLHFTQAEFCDGWTQYDNGDKYMIYDLDYLIHSKESSKISWILTHEQIKRNTYNIQEVM